VDSTEFANFAANYRHMKRVVVGLSGGVDSSVAAYLLKQQGYDVIAVFMINWHDKTGTLEGDCPWRDDLVFAQLVAKKLDIPFHSADLSKVYKKRVIDYMFHEYEMGRTPNPDVLCNREIKFDEFFKVAEKYNADFVATGHYCRKETIEKDGKSVYRLLAGLDPNKEQSYFLCQLNQEQLSKILFPIGELPKERVREIASEQNLPTADKKDSQGICFIGKVDLPTFLQQRLETKKGDVIEIPRRFKGYLDFNPERDNPIYLSQPWQYQPEDGINIGTHNGAHFYTIGQRKGLNIGGKKEPLFIIGTDTMRNIIYTGEGKNHPGLYRKGLSINTSAMHWVRPDLQLKQGESKRFSFRIRYRQSLQKGTLHVMKEASYIIFDKAQRGITPGQFASWYEGDEVIGSGVID
jgi:tRNA-specific 2-thiouridylase